MEGNESEEGVHRRSGIRSVVLPQRRHSTAGRGRRHGRHRRRRRRRRRHQRAPRLPGPSRFRPSARPAGRRVPRHPPRPPPERLHDRILRGARRSGGHSPRRQSRLGRAVGRVPPRREATPIVRRTRAPHERRRRRSHAPGMGQLPQVEPQAVRGTVSRVPRHRESPERGGRSGRGLVPESAVLLRHLHIALGEEITEVRSVREGWGEADRPERQGDTEEVGVRGRRCD
mmetsp:Transcript_9661/g.18280  ORF Transcript_9661/g.18280 Transcript_9661/m.18280 type:complete len:229 (+) Transcript_9661:2992-3678(+)